MIFLMLAALASASMGSAPISVQPLFAPAGVYELVPLQVFGADIDSSCIIWVNDTPCSKIIANTGEVDCSLDTSQLKGPSSVDITVSCLDRETQTMKSAVQLYSPIQCGVTEPLQPGLNLTLTPQGGLPPYRFHLSEIHPCLSLDSKSGILGVTASCDASLYFQVIAEDSVGDRCGYNFNLKGGFQQ